MMIVRLMSLGAPPLYNTGLWLYRDRSTRGVLHHLDFYGLTA